jgi:hypothetical protein
MALRPFSLQRKIPQLRNPRHKLLASPIRLRQDNLLHLP